MESEPEEVQEAYAALDKYLEDQYPGEDSEYEELPAELQPVPKITVNAGSAKVKWIY